MNLWFTIPLAYLDFLQIAGNIVLLEAEKTIRYSIFAAIFYFRIFYSYDNHFPPHVLYILPSFLNTIFEFLDLFLQHLFFLLRLFQVHLQIINQTLYKEKSRLSFMWDDSELLK